MKAKSIAPLLALAGTLITLGAFADPLPPPPNTQPPNMNLVRRVRCVAAAYRVASTPATPSVNMPRMQAVTEGQFLQAFANTGECVGLDAQSALVLMRAQQATLIGGGNGTPSGVVAVGLPTLAAVPTIAPPPPPVAPTAVNVPGVTVQQPVTFVMQSADAGTTTAVVATDASSTTTVVTTDAGTSAPRASRCPQGARCPHGG